MDTGRVIVVQICIENTKKRHITKINKLKEQVLQTQHFATNLSGFDSNKKWARGLSVYNLVDTSNYCSPLAFVVDFSLLKNPLTLMRNRRVCSCCYLLVFCKRKQILLIYLIIYIVFCPLNRDLDRGSHRFFSIIVTNNTGSVAQGVTFVDWERIRGTGVEC